MIGQMKYVLEGGIFYIVTALQSVKKFILASLHYSVFLNDVRIGLLQLNIIYEGQ